MVYSTPLQITQLTGEVGSGTRLSVFPFLQSGQHVAWVQGKELLYAPSLWALAQQRNIHLTGIQCHKLQQLRPLLLELSQHRLFDVWIFDHLNLSQAEGRFLQLILRKHPSPLPEVFILDAKIHTFCRKRYYCSLSHNQFRCSNQINQTFFQEIPFF